MLHVTPERTMRTPLPRLVDLPGGRQGDYLNRAALPFESFGERVSVHLIKGFPAEEIVRHAKERSCDLILMRPHGRGEVGGPLFGPNALRVLETSQVPILFVGPSVSPRDDAPPLKKILVPTDGSEWSAAVLPGVSMLAGALRASAVLFHVGEASEFVERRAEELRRQKIECWIRMSSGDPASAIVSEADGGKFDLIGMSTHGRSGRSPLPAGRVTETVLRHSPVPVLTTGA